MDFLKNVLLFIFSWIDSIIAKLITQVYKLLSNLSELVLYNENMVKVIGGRIGLILGIFMLFKLAVSLISYMISPEKINDNSKGGAKLIKNVIVSLVLLMSINFIFKEAYFIQGKIVNSRIIERIFFGNSGMVVSTNSNQENDIKMDIGYYLYSGFLLPNQEIFEDKCDIVWDVTKTTEDFQECDQLLENNVSDDARKSIYNARNSLDMSYVLSDYDLITATPKPRVHAFNYLPLISNAAGIIVLLVLISFSMDLATRAIKLLFLQIIAPIPIISYMDMGKGQDIFKKWGKECINTYLSVFIRLIAINFAVFMIVLLRGNYKDVFVNNLWLNVFLIIGALMFAKQVPKLLEDFLGIKLDGMSLKPLKKFQEQALFGKQITGLAGAGLASGAAMGANMVSRFRMGASEGGLRGAFDITFGTILSGVAGGVSAAARGTVGALRGQNFGQVYNGAYRGALTARNNRNSRNSLGVSAPEVWLNGVQRALGMDTTADVQDANIKMYDEFVSSGEAAVSISESEVQKYANKIMLGIGSIQSVGGGGANARDVATLTAAGITSATFSSLGELREAMTDESRYDAQTRAALNAEYERLKGDAESAYRRIATNGSSALKTSPVTKAVV